MFTSNLHPLARCGLYTPQKVVRCLAMTMRSQNFKLCFTSGVDVRIAGKRYIGLDLGPNDDGLPSDCVPLQDDV